jgi:hypothetical protein
MGQYLKGTMDEGMSLKHDQLVSGFRTDIYVDADFADGWGYEETKRPS